jgi:hypothetical protein
MAEQLYVIRQTTNHEKMQTGVGAGSVPKMYKKSQVIAEVARLNSAYRMAGISWEATPVTFTFGAPLKE